MTVAFEMGRIARSIGIVIVFAIIGPIAIATVFALVMLTVGVPVLQLVLDVVELDMIRNWLSVAVFLFVFFSFAAAAIPSLVAGVVFAIISIYGGANSLTAALIVAALVVIGVVSLGFFVSPSESSPLFLPSLKGAQQAVFLALFLSIPAAIATWLCWLFTRPLHSPRRFDAPLAREPAR